MDMDNNNQMPPIQPAMPSPSAGGDMSQNEVSRILMSQGSMPGGAPNNNVANSGVPTPQNPGVFSQGAPAQATPGQGNAPAEGMPQVLTADGRPMVQKPIAAPVAKKDKYSLVKTIAIIALSLGMVTFIGLFIWINAEYSEAKEEYRDVDVKVSDAVNKAKDEQYKADQAEYVELEKYPFKTFAGPADYGELSFEYPKTWSVYVAAAATEGGDFNAYFNPVQVDAVGKDTINALRVTIRTKSFDEVAAEYKKAMERKDSGLTMEAVTIAGDTPANRYTGKIPNTDLSGYIVVFKIRDKTVILQTDSVLFKDDFDKLLETIKYNA